MANKRRNLAFFFAIAVALALSSATQFRIPGLPLGVSELIIILTMILHLPLGNGVHGGNQPSKFVPILFLLLLATIPGYVSTLISEGTAFLALYNLIASAYIVVLFTYLHFGYNFKTVSIDQLAKIFLAFSTLYFFVILLLVVAEPTLVYIQDEILNLSVGIGGGNQEVDNAVYRLYGVSNNPNQLAFHAVICTFFSLRYWKENRFLVSLLFLVVSVAVGLLTRSDAYLLSAVALIGVSVVMGIVYGKSVILGLVILVPMLAAAAVLAKPAYKYANELASVGGQDDTRITLWKNGIEAGLEKPLFGLGPGAWSGFEGPKEMEESHNSGIDYFTNGGLVGLSILVVGVLGLGFKTFISKQSTLLAGLIAILLFASFHNVLRQPLMWFGLYYIAHSLSYRSNSTRKRKRQRRVKSPGLPL